MHKNGHYRMTVIEYVAMFIDLKGTDRFKCRFANNWNRYSTSH